MASKWLHSQFTERIIHNWSSQQKSPNVAHGRSFELMLITLIERLQFCFPRLLNSKSRNTSKIAQTWTTWHDIIFFWCEICFSCRDLLEFSEPKITKSASKKVSASKNRKWELLKACWLYCSFSSLNRTPEEGAAEEEADMVSFSSVTSQTLRIKSILHEI